MTPHTGRRRPAPFAASVRQPGLVLPAVVQADRLEARALSWLVGKSFAELDPSVALVGNPQFCVDVLSEYFEATVEQAMTHGYVYVLEDRSAVAVWLDHTRPVPPPVGYEQRRAAAGGAWTQNLIQLDALQEQHQPDHPMHYLAFLAVARELQSTGRGSKLLAHHHAVLDAAGIPAHLAAASWRLTAFYKAHDYRSGEPYHMADHGPAFWPMDRAPQPAS